MINVKCSLWLAALTLLGGCAAIEQEKPINYYVLDTKPKTLPVKVEAKPLRLKPIALPDYLNQPNLVLRDESQQIHVAYYHSWGDALHMAIQRVLGSEINARNVNYNVTDECAKCTTLSVDISHFYPTTQGDVVLSGSYKISRSDNVLRTQHFVIEEALTEDGYQHAVSKMSKALSQLARQISSQLP